VIEGVQLWRDPLAADIAATRLSDPVQGHLEAAAAQQQQQRRRQQQQQQLQQQLSLADLSWSIGSAKRGYHWIVRLRPTICCILLSSQLRLA